MTKLSEVISILKKMAPLDLAESWDNVGLLMEPDVPKPINCVFLTNDLTEDVLQEAESINADLIVSYHPPVFSPFKRITLDTWKSRIMSRCLSRGIAVYSPHTSWDAVENGLTDWLISCFDGTVSPIIPLKVNPEFSHIAIFTSFANGDTSPLDGKQIEKLLESQSKIKSDKNVKILSNSGSQLQLLCNQSVLVSLNELAKSNGIYLHATKNESLPSATTVGAGRYCQLKNGKTIKTVVENLKTHLGVDNLMIALARGSTLDSTINSAAAVAGSGASLLRGVKADLYLTGEMSHHEVLDAVHNNVTVVLANHSNTERNYLKVFAGRLSEEMPRLDVRVSKVDKDPLTFV